MPTPARAIPLRASYLLPVLFLLWGGSALAQAVVLDLRGDSRDRLRTQIQTSLQEVKGLEVVGIATWDGLVKKAKLTPARARAGVGVARLSERAGVTVAVGGRVTGTKFRVQLLDAKGKVLSTRTLTLAKGKLRERDLNRLANAVVAAVETARPSAAAKDEQVAKATEKPADKIAEKPAEKSAPRPAERSPAVASPSRGEDASSRSAALAPSGGQREAKVDARGAEAGASQQVLKVSLFGAANWRSACLAPGSESCVAYKRLEPADQPPGRFVEFGTQIPYSGVGLALEYFPFSAPGNAFEGFGVLVSAQRAWAEVTLRQGLSGSTFTQVSASDDLVTAELSWRFGFDIGGMRAWAGPRGGFTWRNFNVENENEGLLPGSDRRFGNAGLDLGLRVSPSVNLELSGAYAIMPGQTQATRRRFGLEGGSSGFVGHLGVNGKLIGVVGYHVRLNLLGFGDTFEATGQEEEWTAGGVGHEFYTGLELGLSLSF